MFENLMKSPMLRFLLILNGITLGLACVLHGLAAYSGMIVILGETPATLLIFLSMYVFLAIIYYSIRMIIYYKKLKP